MNLLLKTAIPQGQPSNESAIKKPPSRKGNQVLNQLLKTNIPHARPRN
jgi:hypothetical protein